LLQIGVKPVCEVSSHALIASHFNSAVKMRGRMRFIESPQPCRVGGFTYLSLLFIIAIMGTISGTVGEAGTWRWNAKTGNHPRHHSSDLPQLSDFADRLEHMKTGGYDER